MDLKAKKTKKIVLIILGVIGVAIAITFLYFYIGMFMGFVEPMFVFAFLYGVIPLIFLAELIAAIIFFVIKFLIPFIKNQIKKNKN